jgi:hypothetical protein
MINPFNIIIVFFLHPLFFDKKNKIYAKLTHKLNKNIIYSIIEHNNDTLSEMIVVYITNQYEDIYSKRLFDRIHETYCLGDSLSDVI